jgi:DNA-binding transcriptional LysR family regulator
MFSKLFAESGLSLDRLKALLEVGAAGSIVNAAEGDAVRQSQYSRQIKELEDFFRTRLIERQGRGTRLTNNGKELARVSRFFMLGLSNFQRGCLAEQQTFHLGACATFLQQFLLPLLAGRARDKKLATWVTEIIADAEIESRLHDLRLDFGVVQNPTLSRPLQTKPLGEWTLELWVPRGLRLSEKEAAKAFGEARLPVALAKRELESRSVLSDAEGDSCLVCDSFLEARIVLEGQQIAALLPDFLAPGKATEESFMRVQIPMVTDQVFHFHLAWNPRLLRLNPPATKIRDWLAEALARRMQR